MVCSEQFLMLNMKCNMSSVQSKKCALCITQSEVFNEQCKVCCDIVLVSLCSAKCRVSWEQCAECSVLRSACNIQCAVFSMQCTVCSV